MIGWIEQVKFTGKFMLKSHPPHQFTGTWKILWISDLRWQKYSILNIDNEGF